MINQSLIKATCGEKIFERGVALYEQGHVGSLTITDNNGLIGVESDVKSADTDKIYHITIILSQDGNWILDNECTCTYYESNYSLCKHGVAVLLKYIDYLSNQVVDEKVDEPVKETDAPMKQLLNQYTPVISQQIATSDPIRLYPCISKIDSDKGTITVDFKIGNEMEHTYILQNIGKFCVAYQNQAIESYGKYLTFTHTPDAFDPECQPIIDFLLDYYEETMHSSQNQNTSYQFYFQSTPTIERFITLSARQLDDFFLACDYLKVSLYEYDNLYYIHDGNVDFHISLQAKDDGYVFSGESYTIVAGKNFIYYPVEDKREIIRAIRDDQLLPILKFLNQADSESYYIAPSDLPAFAKYIYPILHTKLHMNNPDGFNPNHYLAEKPSFKIYLDYPKENMITGKVVAVYPHQELNVLEKVADDGTRDVEEEQRVAHLVTKWLPVSDLETQMFILENQEEQIFDFLKNGIARLQETASVFISDKLKHLTIRHTPKVSIALDMNRHDLLQLDFVTDSLSLEELSEILSRYDRKKKYYRLKNGEFIEMDESINRLIDLKQSLSLSDQDIAEGSVELPKYRAIYLDELCARDEFDLETSASFRKTIQRMKEVGQEEFDPPVDLQASLRPYQLEGFRWLCALRENGFGGLLADEMGLGKTLQIITFLGAWKDRKRALIVCPASLVYNWHNEIQRFLPSMHSTMIQGTAVERKHLIKESDETDILITSYDLLKRDAKYYENLSFSCQVIDEAQYIKNPGTKAAKAVKSIHSSFRVALTGTPIENRLSELWSIFDYLLPGFLHEYEYFKAYYEMPISHDDDYTERELTRMISPFVLRRLKKDVLKDLPDKLEEVYYAPLEGEQKELYDATTQRIKLALSQQTDQEFRQNKLMILSELTKLRQICCNPSLYFDNYEGNSTKEELCVDTIIRAVESGHKVLLFSQFTSMLDILKKRLTKEKISFYLLTGSTPKPVRAQMVEDFQNNDVKVFCISLKAGGTGLNLTAADIVIHYDPWWNTAVENQASDRAHRIGQKNVVTVYKLIMKDTIEERILKLQQEKSGLADRILSDDNISSAKLTREDLLSLL